MLTSGFRSKLSYGTVEVLGGKHGYSRTMKVLCLDDTESLSIIRVKVGLPIVARDVLTTPRKVRLFFDCQNKYRNGLQSYRSYSPSAFDFLFV
jgi:hypothetical protein